MEREKGRENQVCVCVCTSVCGCERAAVVPGAQGDGGLGSGSLVGGSQWAGPGCSGEGAELLWRGERQLQSSKALQEAADAELHAALALRGWGA